jgi:hypothetical protein
VPAWYIPSGAGKKDIIPQEVMGTRGDERGGANDVSTVRAPQRRVVPGSVLLTGAYRRQDRLLDGAPLVGLPAAGPEAASGGRVGGMRQVTCENDALPAAGGLRIRNRNSAEERLGYP